MRLRIGILPAIIPTVLAAALCPAAGSYAQNVGSPPVPRRQAVPDQPTNQFGMAVEGWVKVRYSVLADGTTADVRAVDTVPPQLPTKDVVRVVQGWTFAPATADGNAIDWYNNESTILFDDQLVPLEPSPRFQESYLAATELFNRKEFDAAKPASERLLEMGVSRLREIGLAHMLVALVNTTVPDMHTAYDAIRRATDSNAVVLPPEELVQALGYRFAIEVQLGRAVDALDTFARRAELIAPGESDPLAAQASAIEEALKGDGAIAVKGYVGRDPWRHTPSRRTFTLVDVDGDVREIEVECDRRKAVLEYMPDVDWTLPESWGRCTLFVAAKRNTTFSLYEFR